VKAAVLAAVVALAAVGGYFVTEQTLRPSLPGAAVYPEAKLGWLAREFALSPEQLATVARLHDAYGPECARHCADIAAAERALGGAATPAARAAAESELARVRQVCAEATRAHLERIAACMPAREQPRFLALMAERIARAPGHRGPPSLDAAP
jgi:hypothetical protein